MKREKAIYRARFLVENLAQFRIPTPSDKENDRAKIQHGIRQGTPIHSFHSLSPGFASDGLHPSGLAHRSHPSLLRLSPRPGKAYRQLDYDSTYHRFAG